MPENIRALIVVIIIAVTTFAILSKPIKKIISPAEFYRWRNLWLAITATAFLVGNFWIFIFVSGLFILIIQQREITKPALFWLLLCVIPATPHSISGLGLINYLFDLNMPGMLALVVLLPALLISGKKGNNNRIKNTGPDFIVILFFIMSSVLALRGTTVTDALRDTVLLFLGTILPYFAFSRALQNKTDIERAMLAYLLPMFIIGILGGFEAVKHWKLYSLPGISNWSGHLARIGILRANVTAGNSIVLGYIMMIAIGFLIPLASSYLTRMQSFMAFGALGMGLVSALSRGPWVGTVVLIAIYISTGRNAARKLATMGFTGIMLLPFLALTPFWQKVVNLIPFIGTTESENIDYRERLFEQSMIVIKRNPVFGSIDFLDTPEMQTMIQGQGIIDLVNTYIQVALEYGFVGLFLFAGFFCLVLIKLRAAYKSLPKDEAYMIQIGRAIFATLVAVLVTIATVSKIHVIPYLYWSLAGLAMAYVHVARQRVAQTTISAKTIKLAS